MAVVVLGYRPWPRLQCRDETRRVSPNRQALLAYINKPEAKPERLDESHEGGMGGKLDLWCHGVVNRCKVPGMHHAVAYW